MRFCIWGGRRGDIWIGSAEDQFATTVRKLTVTTAALVVEFGELVSAPFRGLVRAFGDLV